MSAINHATVAVADLGPHDRTDMFWLMQDHYLGMDRETFECDLAEKEFVMTLRDPAEHGRLVGFSTLMRFDLIVGGRPVKAVFSGDTVVEERKRNGVGFAHEMTRFFVRTLAEFPGVPVFYVLICKGWRTYRVLPILFRDFSPRPARPVDPIHQCVMDAFGAKKYPCEYDAEKGLIVFKGNTQRVRPDSPEALSPIRHDEHIDFFAAKNPHHLRGDELVCVAPVTEPNFTRIFRKFLEAQEVCA